MTVQRLNTHGVSTPRTNSRLRRRWLKEHAVVPVRVIDDETHDALVALRDDLQEIVTNATEPSVSRD